jgi:hemerythrin-like metal-binding protein
MALLNWNPAYSVGIKEIDKEHMKLVDLINELHDAMKSGKGKEVLGKTLNELVNYTAFHFAHEEQLFDKYGYPETAIHKKQHKELVDQVLAYKANYDSGKTIISIDIMNFLKDWLVKHIAGSDKKYTAFLNSKGVV